MVIEPSLFTAQQGPGIPEVEQLFGTCGMNHGRDDPSDQLRTLSLEEIMTSILNSASDFKFSQNEHYVNLMCLVGHLTAHRALNGHISL